MTEELNAAQSRARAVAKRALAHYGEKRQIAKANEEAHEVGAAAWRLHGARLADADIDTDAVIRARQQFLDESADYVVAASALPDRALPKLDELVIVPGEYSDSEIAEAINRKAAAMESRMDRIDEMKRNGEVPTP